MIRRLLERILYRRPRIEPYMGGGQTHRLCRGTAVVSQAVLDRYGIEFFQKLFPDTDIFVVETLLPSTPDDGKDRPNDPRRSS